MSARRATALGVVLIWLAALGWLVNREYFRPHRAALAEGAMAISPSWVYFRVELGGRQVGFASTSVDTTPTEVRVVGEFVTEQVVLGKMRHTEVTTSARLTRLLQLQAFSTRLRTDDGLVTVFGTVEADTVLKVRVESRDQPRYLRQSLTRPLVLAGLAPLRLVFGRELAPGKRYDMQVFDPLRLETRDLALTVAAESTFMVLDSARHDSTLGRWMPARTDTVRTWRVDQRTSQASGHLWIDELGQVVESAGLDGFTLKREAFELAFENFRKRDTTGEITAPSGTIIARTALQERVRPPARLARTLTARLGGTPLDGFDMNGGRQSLTGDTLVVRREADSLMEARYRLPADQRFAADLAPTMLLQSGDPRLHHAAITATGGSKVPRRAAELLLRSVYDRTSKTPTVDVPDALKVLSAARGDCNELTALYVALARSVGLPARPVSGLWYAGGRFYVHTWPEVFLNGWVAVDPTLGQFPADAAHLRFMGGLARPLEQASILGGLSITVLGVESER
jgi:hypothetical protein